MAVDYNQPTNSTTYTSVLQLLHDKINDVAKGITSASTNIPTNAIRFNTNKWQKWSGTAWADLATSYAISITGNAATVTNGVYVSGDQTIAGIKTFSDRIYLGTAANDSTPNIAHSTNTDTGIYFVSTTEIAITIDGTKAFYVDSTGITSSGNVTAYSDIRLKKDLVPLKDSLNKIKQLTGYLYTKKQDNSKQVGLIAQEVEKVLPEAVKLDEDGYLSLAYGNLAALFVEAIKDLDDRIQSLEQRV